MNNEDRIINLCQGNIGATSVIVAAIKTYGISVQITGTTGLKWRTNS